MQSNLKKLVKTLNIVEKTGNRLLSENQNSSLTQSYLVGGGCTMLSFAVSRAKNCEEMATLKTLWKVKFLPTSMIPWHLEAWPAAPKPLSSI